MNIKMQRIKQFFKDWWKAMGESIEREEEEFYSPPPQRNKDTSHWCPFCGYIGSADEVRCHLLNYHKQ